jgi:hypothetical protein
MLSVKFLFTILWVEGSSPSSLQGIAQWQSNRKNAGSNPAGSIRACGGMVDATDDSSSQQQSQSELIPVFSEQRHSSAQARKEEDTDK